MTEASASNYWINSTALSITLNVMGDADYIQANVVSGAMIMCYMRNIDGLGYDAGHNYRRWNLIANPTYFNLRPRNMSMLLSPASRKIMVQH